MKNLIHLTLIIALVLAVLSCKDALIDDAENEIALKSGNSGNNKPTGFDEWGFNWNAHQFHGYTVNMLLGDHYFMGWPHYKQHVYNGQGTEFWNYLVDTYYLDFGVYQWHYFPDLMPGDLLDSKLVCIWNDALINSDGEYPQNGWMDTDAWIVFDYSGEVDGKSWKSMRKLVAAKSTDELIDGTWYTESGEEIGLDALFWSDLIVVQVVNSGDVPPFPFFYYDYNSANGPGYGQYKLKR